MNTDEIKLRPPLIEMWDVTVNSMKSRGEITAENIDWTVAESEFWLIAGVQRSGKTDLLMLTGGLMPPAKGTYRFCGEEMPIFEEERISKRLRLGFLFAEGHLFNQMTVAENVGLSLCYHENLSTEEAKPRVQTMLELTELVAFANSTPDTMARNWRKRVGLARALILRPDVLLLDEPLAGLDARHSAWWLRFLDQLSRGHSQLQNKRMTIIATTDDLSPSAGWRGRANRVACLIDRRVQIFSDWPQVDSSRIAVVRALLNAEASDN